MTDTQPPQATRDAGQGDLCRLDARTLARLICTRQTSAVEVVDACLNRIAQLNPEYNLFCFVYEQEARQQALRADAAVRDGGPLGPLHGVPYALKDFTPTAGKRTTLGCMAYKDWIPSEDPPLVERLATAGGILVGKTTTAELAHSSFTRSALWGVSRNPWDPSKTPGGSSGGSAGAVAAGMVPLAEGSDAGGSIRIPASCCGVVGFKPSHGRVPMHSTGVDYEQIFHHGPIARSADDCALMFSVMQGPDDRDPLSQECAADLPGKLTGDVTGLRVALSVDLGYYEVDAAVAHNTHLIAERLRERGAVVDEVDIGWSRQINDAWFDYWAVLLAARYAEPTRSHRDAMDPALVRLLERGERMSAIAFKRIDQTRTEQWAALRPILDSYAILLCPTLAIPVPPAEGYDDDSFSETTPSGRYAGLDTTSPINLIPQCPAISVPSGKTSDGMPTGAHLIGRRFADRTVLEAAKAVEPHQASAR